MTCCSIPLNVGCYSDCGKLRSCTVCSPKSGRHVFHPVELFGESNDATEPRPHSQCNWCRWTLRGRSIDRVGEIETYFESGEGTACSEMVFENGPRHISWSDVAEQLRFAGHAIDWAGGSALRARWKSKYVADADPVEKAAVANLREAARAARLFEEEIVWWAGFSEFWRRLGIGVSRRGSRAA